MEEEYVSVKEFARATERFPNQIYDLVNKGNSFGKLKTVQQDGQIMIPVSEIKEFPFNASDAVRIEFEKRLDTMEKRLIQAERTIMVLEGRISSLKIGLG